MSQAHRRKFAYQFSQIEHDLIAAAAREHGCQPRDVIVRAVAAFAPKAVVEVDRETKLELRQLANVITAPKVGSLTPRESEVLVLLAQGLSNKLIAAQLFVSEHTAKFHVNQLAKKTGASTRTAIVVEAMQRGWLMIERPEQVPTIGELVS